MYVVKIKHGETLRRIVLDECFSYDALWKLVSERFELPATFCGVLRYEDPDGDLISLSTDDEVEEALRLCGDGKTLKMTLSATQGSAALQPALQAPAAQVDPTGKAWAGALSNPFEDKEAAAQVAVDATSRSPRASLSSASGDFEMVESDSRPASSRSSAAASQADASQEPAPQEAAVRPVSVDAEDEALQAALKASAEEAAAREAAEEAARLAAEEEAARLAAEEEAARLAAEEEAARKAAEEEAARKAAEEEAARKAAEEEARATEEDEKKARLEIAFAAAEEDALRRADELFNMGCAVDQIRTLYGESILMQLRLVPRISDACYEVPAVPEPVVNWEAARAVAEQEEQERFPSQEQAAVVDEVGDLAARLTAFYFEHNTAMIETVGEVSRKFLGREQELNDALMRKYKCDLNTVVAEQAAACAVQEEQDAGAARRFADQDEEFADAHSEVADEEEEPMDEVTREAVANLEAMGFTDRSTNLALLAKYANNVEAALNELLG